MKEFGPPRNYRRTAKMGMNLRKKISFTRRVPENVGVEHAPRLMIARDMQNAEKGSGFSARMWVYPKEDS